MRVQGNRPVSGHVFRVPRKRGAQWYVKYRGPDGRQVQRRLGQEWTESGPAPVGFLTRKTAEAALQAILTDVRRGSFEVVTQTGATVAEAAAEWLRQAEFERGVKPSTLREYNSILSAHLVPAFGERPVEALTTRDIELWRSRLIEQGKLSRRTINKVLTALGGVMGRAQRLWDLPGQSRHRGGAVPGSLLGRAASTEPRRGSGPGRPYSPVPPGLGDIQGAW
jgi:hypothetical protein